MSVYEKNDFTVLTGWTDGSTGNGVVSAVTFDNRSALKIDSGTAPGFFAKATKDLGSFGSELRVKTTLYHDAVGSFDTDQDAFKLIARWASFEININFGSDGLAWFDGSTYTEIGTNIVDQDTWTDWEFVFINATSAANVDCTSIRKNGVEQLSATIEGIGISSSRTLGELVLFQNGQTTVSRITYVDKLEVSDNYLTGSLEVKDDNSVDRALDYLVRDRSDGSVLETGTTPTDGYLNVLIPNNTDTYDVIMLDPLGTYPPKIIAENVNGGTA